MTVLLLVTIIFTWLHIKRVEHNAQQALLELRVEKNKLSQLSSELQTVKLERDSLVKQRIPGLIPLSFDETITPDNRFIRNIIFTLLKTGDKEHYEYRIVMHNDSLSVVDLKVTILLFNDVGIQIGQSLVDQTMAAGDSNRAALDPGEVRTYTASIQLTRDQQPGYFMLEVAEVKQASTDTLRRHLGDVVEQ